MNGQILHGWLGACAVKHQCILNQRINFVHCSISTMISLRLNMGKVQGGS
jgi:hypothetical protein